ncbi:beta-ketoacyl-[acyl-carrier-protein] synthase family protein [Buchananella hordeovulneris]|uniref:Beta-ketoacyl-[acyl-carrier-protein] synthase II n=1 Tax=Buchananella hordeovulneris TaxID=52770 RepID=A0A1Q5PX85_9ACTO|nr:beta-ketoacyl-[acyl-carrier-protein] synthase family protein [Buchananella hordeovulneris]MDO5080341.1 beta-ketoacyl-[acyl-carrier-protein] synthase family protein [Buchananella hordeovulneris]OKL52167.1 beta-ketoacyl-[acyl-carrier-protein] synthase II [Buchananella hordeovulneris]RRD44894.1 beta-ketoacyl-[acyl-carrier-protein] synthase family protein [Buchananella hordeovulneris]RRD52478.1 beta-ketoacyl-[acyl-carrier-protein] synthase family protein [Buchananella hordeovulneris]
MTEVVVTGLGTFNPLGGDVPSTWQEALAGRSAVKTIEADWIAEYEIPVDFAAQVAVDPAEVLSAKELSRTDPVARYALISAKEAWQDAGQPAVEGERLGVVIGTGIGGVHTILGAWDAIRAGGARRAKPLTVPLLMGNSPAATISVAFGAKAGAHAPVSACASGAEAIAYGAQMIRSGRADVVICGGSEAAVHPLPLAAFARMRALSTRTDDPATACRPYDTTRDGFVLGEGAGVLVLESAEHAARRGARVHARLLGVGMTADAFDIAPPDPTGAGQERAMRIALEDAGLDGAAIDHVNAHATSTPAGDVVEAHAIARVAPRAAVSATKSASGHLLGGAGAFEAVLTVLAVRERLAPPTINVTEPEEDLRIDLVRDEPRPLAAQGPVAAINNSFGFGGHNVALVFASAS